MRTILTSGGRRRPLRTTLGLVAAFAVAVSGLTFGTIAAEQTTTEAASAATASSFDPGYIISDKNFYNGSAMTGSEVQSFLNTVGASCRQASGGPICLKNFTQNVSAIKAVSGRCAAIAGGNKSAATIIAQVGSACGVSQKALIVLLEKEQGIISTSSPTNWMYQHATGFACPDTAPCDPAYRGFAQQVYAAALQFKRYQASPTSWAYQAGRNNSILYNPDATCGRKTVYIQNQATAGLYIYTPYTPNKSALDNLYGSGDRCGAYGNRNFWRMYTDWFGSPTGNSSPTGHIDAVRGSNGSIGISGWAADPDTTAPLRVAFYVDGVGKRTVDADIDRGDLASRLGAGNTKHGFSTNLTGIAPGNRSVCAIAINQGPGSNATLGCATVSVGSNPPKGVLDTVRGGTNTIAVAGWVLDPDSSAAPNYKVQVDGVGAIDAKADRTRNDVAKVNPGVGSTLGFSNTITKVAAGTRQVSLWTQDKPGTKWVKLVTKTATVTDPTTGSTGQTGAVKGAYDSATVGTGTVSVSGWAIDPDVYDPVKYKIHIDGLEVGSGSATATRGDVARRYPGWGSDVGLNTTVKNVKPGKHSVVVWYQDLPRGKYVKWGTKTVTVPGAPSTTPTASPTATPTTPPTSTGKTGPVMGAYDSARAGKGTVSVSGWAIDPDVSTPVKYKLHIDGLEVGSGSANATRTDVERVHPGWGSDVGLNATVTGVKAGQHSVVVWYLDMPRGKYVKWGTKTVTVS